MRSLPLTFLPDRLRTLRRLLLLKYNGSLKLKLPCSLCIAIGYSFLRETLAVKVYTGFFLIHARMSMRLKCSSKCYAVNLYPMLEFISAEASSIDPVEREHRQKILSGSSEPMERYCKKALPLAKHAARLLDRHTLD